MSEIKEVPQPPTNLQRVPLVRRIGQILGINRNPTLPPETTLLEQRRIMESHDDPSNLPPAEDFSDARLIEALK